MVFLYRDVLAVDDNDLQYRVNASNQKAKYKVLKTYQTVSLDTGIYVKGG